MLSFCAVISNTSILCSRLNRSCKLASVSVTDQGCRNILMLNNIRQKIQKDFWKHAKLQAGRSARFSSACAIIAHNCLAREGDSNGLQRFNGQWANGDRLASCKLDGNLISQLAASPTSLGALLHFVLSFQTFPYCAQGSTEVANWQLSLSQSFCQLTSKAHVANQQPAARQHSQTQTLHRNGCKGHWQRLHLLLPLDGVDQPFCTAHVTGPSPVPAAVTAMTPHTWHLKT